MPLFRRPPSTPTGGAYLPPWVLQVTGIGIVIGGSAFWAVTDHQSALIIGAGMGLTGIGAYSGLHISIREQMRRPDDEDKDAG